MLSQSQKNGKIVWKHGQSKEKSPCYLEVYLTSQISGHHFKENMACSEGDQLLVGDLHAVLDKREADMLLITKK